MKRLGLFLLGAAGIMAATGLFPIWVALGCCVVGIGVFAILDALFGGP